MARTLMITEQEIKDLTSITDNVDVKKFCPWIPIAQDIYIQAAIRETCYKELLDQIATDTVTADFQTLLDGNDRNFAGLKVALAWWVLYKAYPDLASYIAPTGINVKIGEKFSPVDPQVLEQRILSAKDVAERYTDQLICYMEENDELFACFKDTDCDCTQPLKDGYSHTSGIVLDDGLDRLNEFDRLNGRKFRY